MMQGRARTDPSLMTPAATIWSHALADRDFRADVFELLLDRFGFGALSTRSFASFRPRLVTSRTTLMTLILSPPVSVSVTLNSVFSSTAAAAAAPPPTPGAATATAAAALTP